MRDTSSPQDVQETPGGANGNEEAESATPPAPTVSASHQAVMEVCDQPPAELLDAGNEDILMVRCFI